MSMKGLLVGMAAAVVLAVPAAAQQRGTMEFGAFASGANFERSLSLATGYGGGGRIGMFLDPRFSFEFEDAEMRASRPNGLRNVNVGILSTRLVVSSLRVGSATMFFGAGAGVSTETNFLHTYGADGMVGLRFALSDHAAFRTDAVVDFLANNGWHTYQSLRMGISWYRHPDVVVNKK
jgi:hypothetical protein